MCIRDRRSAGHIAFLVCRTAHIRQQPTLPTPPKLLRGYTWEPLLLLIIISLEIDDELLRYFLETETCYYGVTRLAV